MGILLSDTFDRVVGTLGGDWTEQSDPECPGLRRCAAMTVDHGSVCTNMSTDGALAQIDAIGFNVATANASNLTNQYVQAWCMAKAGNNAGLVFRFKSTCAFFFVILDPVSTNLRLFKRLPVGGTVINTVIAQTVGGVAAGTWQRIAVVATDIGGGSTRIEVYLDNLYNTTNEGPSIVAINSDAALQGSGLAGICSSGNNATGAAGPQWNDFIARDGQPETIYVDKDFNGGLPGAGFGTAARPDLEIDWGLNNAGLVRGSKLKLTDPLYANAGAGTRYRIGHGAKFSAVGYSFPTYSDDSGEVTNPGNPNLIIEGADGATRTECRETSGLAAFFTLRKAGVADANTARGVVFRGLDFRATGAMRAVYTESSASGDHGFQLDKCSVRVGPTAGASPIIVQAPCTQVGGNYLYFDQTSALDTNADVIFFSSAASVRSSRWRMCVFDGIFDQCINYSQLMPTWQAGDVHDIDHCTAYMLDLFARTAALGGTLDPNDIAAGSRLTIQNSVATIIRSGAPLASAFGAYAGSTAAPGGTMEVHHNGWDTDLTACYGPPGHQWAIGAGETCGADPAYVNEVAAFLWQHTSGKGLLGEGTFAAMTIARDLRVTALGFKDAADDSTPLQILDKGALQDFFPVGVVTPAGSPPPVVEEGGPAFCPSIIYDPSGPNEKDLSGRLMNMRGLKQERDVLLRAYRGSDLDMDFMDVEGDFLEVNPGTFLLGPDGRPNWYGKPVVVAGLLGSAIITRYRGFVVGVESERGIGRLQVANRLQFMFDRLVRANSIGKVVSTSGAAGVGPAILGQPNAPASGFYLGSLTMLGQTPFDPATAPIAQTWTVTFTTSGATPTFYVTGSETGFDGEGQYGTAFSYVSKSGTIAINTAVGGDFSGAGPVTKDQTCTIATVWRALPASLTSFAALRAFLLDPRGGGQWPSGHGLVAADLDPAFDAFLGTVHDQTIDNLPNSVHIQSRLVIDAAKTVLDAIDEIARHSGVVVVELSDALIGAVSVLPRLLASVPEIICKSEDLESAKVGHLPIYNDFSFEYDYDERLGRFQEAEHYPTPATANDSLAKYGRLFPAPAGFQYRGFTGSNLSWIQTIMAALYVRYRDPRRTYPLMTTIARQDAELDDVYSLDSEAPTFRASAIEPYDIERMLTGQLDVSIQAVDVSDLVTVGAGCGYLQYDNPAMGYDQCWGYL